MLYGFHLWTWVAIITRCISSFSIRSLSHCRWTLSTSNKLVIKFVFSPWISSSHFQHFQKSQFHLFLPWNFFSNKFKNTNNRFKGNNNRPKKINKQRRLTKWEKKRLIFFVKGNKNWILWTFVNRLEMHA